MQGYLPPNRRSFLRGVLGGAALAAGAPTPALGFPQQRPAPDGFTAVATWSFSSAAVLTAGKMLREGATRLDAVERGINGIETDPEIDSVGLGGIPNAAGVVELDAAFVDGPSETLGSVAGLTDVAEAVSVARRIAERTEHIALCGDGAREFALSQGFQRRSLLTGRSRELWEKWKADPESFRGRGHDTVALIVRDAGGLTAGCSSSGLSWKKPGRVGDAAWIGAGIYADRDGAAVATGIGELCMRHCAAFAAVEMMRAGQSPDEACRQVIRRIADGRPEARRWQVGLIAVDADGQVGCYAIQRGFQIAVFDPGDGEAKLEDSEALMA